MRGFVAARIKPYYLHHGDLAPGTVYRVFVRAKAAAGSPPFQLWLQSGGSSSRENVALGSEWQIVSTTMTTT